MTQFTQQQQTAIHAPGSLLVAAAAGAGKTAVLTERIVEKIRAGTSVKALLVVTFTNAAAADMKKRIAARLREAARTADADAQRLRDAAEDTQNASISTIHAFCMQVLRRHFYAAGIDPAFRVADAAEGDILLQDALDELLEARLEEPPCDTLCDMLGGAEALGDALVSLREFMQARPDPQAFLTAAAAAYRTTPEELAASAIVRERVRAAKVKLRAGVESVQGARDALADIPQTAAVVDAELMQLRGVLLQGEYDGYAAALAGMAFGTLRFPKGTAEEEKAPLKTARDALKKVVAKQREGFSRSLAEEAARMGRLHPYVEALCGLTWALECAYGEKKRARGVIDYADMEHMALGLLQKSDIAREYRERFDYIFVDEYQDANRVQEAIFQAVRRADNLFLVGDVKQSIYGFRQAEPALFMEKYDAPESFGGSVVDLNANFRSAAPILAFVNQVFERVMTRESGGVEYNAQARLLPGRALAGCVEVHALESGDEEWESAEAEALCIAARIRDIMANETYLDPKTGKTRPYRYGDFAVLHRAPKRVAERMTQLLSLCGVPAYAELTGGYFAAVEVQVFLNLLRVVDNRRQDIPLLSVLRSSMGGFTDQTLQRLRAAYPEGDWTDALLRAARQADPLGEQARAFLDKLDGWYAKSRLLGAGTLCGLLLDETGYGDECAALPGGKVRRANLEAIVTRAEAYERSEGGSLSGFIAWMDRVKSTDRLGAAANLGADVVRLLSTHRSKGLEFPVVFVCGLSKMFNLQENREDVVMHAELGVGLRYREARRRMDTLARDAILSANQAAALREEMRILYVAMTRAQSRLALVISAKDLKAEVQKHALPLTPALLGGAKRASDWVLWALLAGPDGNSLLACADLPGHPGTAQVETFLHTGSPAMEARAQQGDYRTLLQGGDPTAWAARFAWQYAYAADTRVPGKLSVSELTGNLPSMRAYPDFIAAGRELDAAGKGTAAHLLMELIPLQAHTPDSVRAALEALVQSGRMSEQQAKAVYVPAVVRFFNSDLGKRLCASPCVKREMLFNHRVSARALTGADTEEPVLLQGVIDCCFMEEDGWVLLDYKTDFVPEGQAEAVARTHKGQLALYAAALRALTGKPVREQYIHLLRTGESVKL